MKEPEKKIFGAITVINHVDSSQLKQDLSYSSNDLTSAMMDQASLFAHYGVLLSQASAQVDKLKMLLEAAESRIYRQIRDAADLASEKTTEAQIKAGVAGHGRILEIKKALNEAKQIESLAKTAVEAFRHRRDMLIQHGLIEREEMKGQVSIMTKRAHEEQMQGVRERVSSSLKARREGASEE